jgi:hypothetical protein
MLSTIAFVGVTTRTGGYSFNKSKQHLEITVDFPVQYRRRLLFRAF